nr:cleavage and polyadenylation specificity factor subunit 6-like [Salvelinus alpinus]
MGLSPPGPPPHGFGLLLAPLLSPQQALPPPGHFPPRPPGPLGPPLALAPPPHMTGPRPGGPPPAPHVNPAFFPPPGGPNNMGGPPGGDGRGPNGPNDPYGRPPPYDRGDFGPAGSNQRPPLICEFDLRAPLPRGCPDPWINEGLVDLKNGGQHLHNASDPGLVEILPDR